MGAAEDRPPAPWGTFPLGELTVLAGLGLLIAGAIVRGGRGPILVGGGLTLAALSGLELSIREHFAGFRSHTLMLSAVPALAVLGGLFYVAPSTLPPGARVAIAGGVFAACGYLLYRAFRSRAGVGFKIR